MRKPPREAGAFVADVMIDRTVEQNSHDHRKSGGHDEMTRYTQRLRDYCAASFLYMARRPAASSSALVNSFSAVSGN